jgi:GTPase SAR1 family protein
MVHIYLASVSHLIMPSSSYTYTHKALLPLHTSMMSPSPELHVKILMIGNSSVGKSSLLMRWSENQWLPEDDASATIGVEVKVSVLLTPIETL